MKKWLEWRAWFSHHIQFQAYTKPLTQMILIVGSLLLLVSLLMGYFYYSTIGHIGPVYAKHMMIGYLANVLIFMSYVIALEWLCGLIRYRTVYRFKPFLSHLMTSPTLAYAVLYLLLLAYDTSFSAVLGGGAIVVLGSQLSQKGYSYYIIHPVIIGYLSTVLIEIGNYAKLDLLLVPTLLRSPFTEVVGEQIILTYDQFEAAYYSVSTVFFGLYEGSLSFTLILFILLSGGLLLKQRQLNLKYIGIYLGGYALVSLFYCQVLQLDPFMSLLSLLNGNVLFIAIFLLSDPVVLPKGSKQGLIYVLLMTILTVSLTYGFHFIVGPFVALLISQCLIYITRLRPIKLMENSRTMIKTDLT